MFLTCIERYFVASSVGQPAVIDEVRAERDGHASYQPRQSQEQGECVLVHLTSGYLDPL